MENDWWPDDFDYSELNYGIPTSPKNIVPLTKKILYSPYIDHTQGFDLEILLDLSRLDDELFEPEPEYTISLVTDELRPRIESLLQDVQTQFKFEYDMSPWDEGYSVVTDYTEDRKTLLNCIKFLVSQSALFEYCTLGTSFCLAPISELLDDSAFLTICEEIEKRTGGKFSIRGTAELGPYDGIEAGSTFYQVILLLSPLYEFPLQFFRGHSEDNRLASPYYYYVLSKICNLIDCKLTLIGT
ncbi:MAG: hypothetical protein PVF58_13340 [Candidatus Methanofastidiosia archaeon]|jgi:hypothetical protein